MPRMFVLQDPEDGGIYGVYSTREKAEAQIENTTTGEVTEFVVNAVIPPLWEASWSLKRCKATGVTKEVFNGLRQQEPVDVPDPPVGCNVPSWEEKAPYTWAYGRTQAKASHNAREWFEHCLKALKEGRDQPNEFGFKVEL